MIVSIFVIINFKKPYLYHNQLSSRILINVIFFPQKNMIEFYRCSKRKGSLFFFFPEFYYIQFMTFPNPSFNRILFTKCTHNSKQWSFSRATLGFIAYISFGFIKFIMFLKWIITIFSVRFVLLRRVPSLPARLSHFSCIKLFLTLSFFFFWHS